MKKRFKTMISLLLVLTMLFSLNFTGNASAHTDNNSTVTEDTESTPSIATARSLTAVKETAVATTSDKKVDLTFVIDSTGSMSDAIYNVKDNITEFAQYLESKGLTLRIGIVEYRDITCDGMDSTVVHKYNYTTWHNNTSQMVETLGVIEADGGGDTPEALVDAMGYLVDGETMLWSSNAYKFAVVLTDASYKIDNRFHYTSMNEVIDKLVKQNINTSVICSNYDYNTYYKTMTDRTGGIFGDIYSDNFSSVLKDLADRVIGETLKKNKAIYVLPGYMGSKLYDETGTEIWADPTALYNDAVAYSLPLGRTSLLTLNSDGTGSKVHADITKDKYGTQDTYKTLVTSLKDSFSTDYDVVFFPYNWLGDLNDSAQSLQDHINMSGYDNVVFVTHSTGGLLASAYIAASRENKLKVEKAILIAAPLYGTYTALEPIETGKTAALDSMLASSGVDNGLFGLKYKAIYAWVKAITKNSPTTYQLLPSIEYLKRMPAIYGSDFTGTAVITKNQYYEVLNGSSNINSSLTNGDTIRSHKYFRDTVLKDDIVDVWQNDIEGTLQEVDTLLVGSGYGNLTPAIAVYSNKLLGGTKLNNIIYKLDGDGTVLDVSAFATSDGYHRIKYMDYKGLSHGELANNSTVIGDIINYIKDADEITVKSLALRSEDPGMSDFVTLRVESDEHVDILIQDATGTTIASVINKDEMISYGGTTYPYSDILVKGFDGKRFIYLPFSTEYAGTDALIYMPSTGYKVSFNYGSDAETNLKFNCDLSSLDQDGFKTATANYRETMTGSGGNILTLDMTTKKVDATNVNTLVDSEVVKKTDFNSSWELNSLTLSNIGDTQDIEISTAVSGSSIISVVTGGSIALNWTSSDERVASVSSLGKVTAKGYGQATIAATDGNKISTCIVDVSTSPTSIEISDISMVVGEKVLLKPRYAPLGVTDPGVDYEYNEEKGIIRIDRFGVITALKEGSDTVTISTSPEVKASFTVTVTNSGITSVHSVSILPSELSLSIGGSDLILNASITPSNATDLGVTWYVEDSSIASLSYEGLYCYLSALKVGTTKVTVVTSDGGYTASVDITVTDKPIVSPIPTTVPTTDSTTAPTATPSPTPTATPTPTPIVEVVTINAAIGTVNKAFNGEVNATVLEGKGILSIQIPSESILEYVKESGANKVNPLQLSLTLPANKLLNFLYNKSIKSVTVNLITSTDLFKNNAVTIKKLDLTSSVLKLAKRTGKDLLVSIIDGKGQSTYEWFLDGKILKNSSRTIANVNLAFELFSANKLVKTAYNRDSENTQGLVVHFLDNKLPCQLSLKFYIGNQKFIKPGQSVFVYRYNKVTDRLDTLKGGFSYKVDEKGFITLKALDCSDYIILPKLAGKFVTSSLINQISILLGNKTIKLQGASTSSAQLAISMPDSLEWVTSLTNNKAPNGAAAFLLTFKSSNPTVAVVNAKGKITAKHVGKTTITATIKLYNGKTKTIQIPITVKNK